MPEGCRAIWLMICRAFCSLAYRGKPGQGQSPLPSDDSPVVFQQNEVLVSVPAAQSCRRGQVSSPRSGQKLPLGGCAGAVHR